MYGPESETEQKRQGKEQGKKEAQSVRVSMVWSRFKEEVARKLATGQLPNLMTSIDSPLILERRKLCAATVNSQETEVRAGVATVRSKASSTEASTQKKAQGQNAQIEKMVALVGRMSSVKV